MSHLPFCVNETGLQNRVGNKEKLEEDAVRLLVLYILFTQSKVYSYIKNCSSYKNNGTHMKLTVFLRQIYLMRISIHDWKFYPVT